MTLQCCADSTLGAQNVDFFLIISKSLKKNLKMTEFNQR